MSGNPTLPTLNYLSETLFEQPAAGGVEGGKNENRVKNLAARAGIHPAA
jgi:hypothetical protein